MTDHDAIAARARDHIARGGSPYIAPSEYLDLYDEVKRLRAERDAGKRTVPAGQTPLDDKLNHRFLDVIREGEAARDAGTASPYHGHSLEHCLHATGWVSRDLRLALDEARARTEKAEAERDRLRAALLKIAEYLPSFDYVARDEFGKCTDLPGSPYDRGKADASAHLSAIARAALKGDSDE